MLSPWRTASGFDPMEVTQRLRGEFYDWLDKQPEPTDLKDSFSNQGGIDPNNPLGHWPTIEDFLKDKYPAAHRGFLNGKEDAGEFLDDPDAEPLSRYDDEDGGYWPEPYLSADHEKLGYDPKEVAAGMLLLHNRAHSGRGDAYMEQDKKRLVDIFNKRQQMQRNYEQRNARLKTAADLAKEYTDQLNDEFHDWAIKRGKVPVGFPAGSENEWDYTKPMGGPLTYWDNIEGFFKERYPEAYRGFNMAEEKARPLMDNGRATWSAETMRAKPYETGSEAEAKYGYDPKALAAGMIYLHNWAHAQSAQNSWRGDKLPRDINRLNDIFQKRQQMQRNYEQNQAVTNAPH